jgi:hypothetical protein
MPRPRRERRLTDDRPVRLPFGALAHAALRRRLLDVRGQEADWETAANLGWVRWQREERRYVYVAIRRRTDGLTGELGVALAPLPLDELPVVRGAIEEIDEGRFTLGHMLHGHDRLWASGGSEKALIARLDWLAQQLQLRIHSFLSTTTRRAG